MAERLRRLTRKPKVRTAVGSNPALDSLVAVRNSSPGRPQPCEGNLVTAAGSCGGLMVKHPWPLLEISLSDFRRLATLDINTYLPIYKTEKATHTQIVKGKDGIWQECILVVQKPLEFSKTFTFYLSCLYAFIFRFPGESKKNLRVWRAMD